MFINNFKVLLLFEAPLLFLQLYQMTYYTNVCIFLFEFVVVFELKKLLKELLLKILFI